MIWARAGISYSLLETVDDGHCGLPRDELLSMAETLLEIPSVILEDAIRFELADGVIVADSVGDRECVFLRRLWEAERVIAGRIAMLREGQPPWPSFDADRAIPWVKGKLGVTLAKSQKDAVRMALASELMVITGGRASARPPW